jgi:cobyrinic acid a,c-diamide synthase
MLPPESMIELFQHSASKNDLALIEGVMGLFDGRSEPGGGGSSAEISKHLKVPVILVLNVAKMSQSAAAVVLGFKKLDLEIKLAGVILNHVGSPNHLRMLRQAIEGKTGVPVVGYLDKHSSINLPERHLGLIPSSETTEVSDFLKRLAIRISDTVNVDLLLDIAHSTPELPDLTQSRLFPSGRAKQKTVIGVAMDDAFNFYYHHNFDILKAWGAELKFFSPLKDAHLPEKIDGLYLGGGFPEVFNANLSKNKRILTEIRKIADTGLPIYAECGGLMYLSQGIRDFNGKYFEMVGLINGVSVMQKRRERLGYAVAEAKKDSIIAKKGQRLKGHIFHWSKLPNPSETMAAYNMSIPSNQPEGFITGPKDNVLASYLHLHFGSDIELAKRFIASCSQERK